MKCAFEDAETLCPKNAEVYARDRSDKNPKSRPKKYCKHHAEVVAHRGNPEYTVNCPRCNCLFGVN